MAEIAAQKQVMFPHSPAHRRHTPVATVARRWMGQLNFSTAPPLGSGGYMEGSHRRQTVDVIAKLLHRLTSVT